VGGPSGTVTFLFTDVEGSTRLWEAAPEAMRAALHRHDVIVRQAIEGHGGYVFATGGDGFAAAFARAGDALGAAADAQAGLVAEDWPEGAAIRVRMGIHTGEAEERDGDYFGTAVNRASRLMTAAHGGQVLVSSAAASVADLAGLQDLGELRVRDLGEPQHVFQLGDGVFGPLRSLEGGLGNLPLVSSSLVGREDELAAVAEALAVSRLVTVVGVGGVGKTHLALEAARRASISFADGAWLVELAAITAEAGLVDGVASALGAVRTVGGSMTESLGGFLRTKRMLVVLDNCEHLLGAAAELVDGWLRVCPDLVVAATSREPLGVHGERVIHLGSLRFPRGTGLEEATASPAVRLFCERAVGAGGDLTLDDTNVASIATICRRLDGIPLALELAAARVRSMAVADLERRLDHTFRLLVGSGGGAVERHQTLRRAIEWSYDLLDDRERVVFERLSVFVGGFSLAAAETVVADVDSAGRTVDALEVVDAVGALVDKSMVQLDAAGSEGRYRLLETLRLFGAERLAAAGEADDTRRAHARWCVAYLDAASHSALLADGGPWWDNFRAEKDNIVATARWVIDAGDVELACGLVVSRRPASPHMLSEVEVVLARVTADWVGFSNEPPRRDVLAAAAWALSEGELGAAAALAEQVIRLDPAATDLAACNAHVALGTCALITDLPHDLEEHCRMALDIASSLIDQDEGGIAPIWVVLSWVPHVLAAAGHSAAARRAAAHSRELADRLDSPVARSFARATLGWVLVEVGEYDEALPLLEASVRGGRAPTLSGGHWTALARARAAAGGAGCLEEFRGAIEYQRRMGFVSDLVSAIGFLAESLARLDSPRSAALLDGWSAAHARPTTARRRQLRDATIVGLAARLGIDRLADLQADGRTRSQDEIVASALTAIDRYLDRDRGVSQA